jgi:hypothetical protein
MDENRTVVLCIYLSIYLSIYVYASISSNRTYGLAIFNIIGRVLDASPLSLTRTLILRRTIALPRRRSASIMDGDIC